MTRTRIRSRLFYGALGALVALLVVGSFSLGRIAAQERGGTPVVVLPHPAFAQSPQPDGKTLTVADVAERALPAVVNIATTRKARLADSPFHSDPFFRDFLRRFGPGDATPRAERGLG